MAGLDIFPFRSTNICERPTLTDWEDRVILRSNPEGKTLLQTASGDVFSLVHPALKSLVDQHGIILSAWTEEQPYALGRLGYIARNIQHCVGGGRHNAKIYTKTDYESS